MKRIVVARLDNLGDVILAGPALRLAARHGRVTLLCGPQGEAAADYLPGVDEVLVWESPWTGFDPPSVNASSIEGLVATLRHRRFHEAAILTSFHQSPLPLALLLRLAGIPRIAAVGVDYPGSLVDERVPYVQDIHEVEQALLVVAALGYETDDDTRLSLRIPELPGPVARPYVVVHPGASVPARSMPAALTEELLAGLAGADTKVVVTGSTPERERMPLLMHPNVHDLRGRTTFAQLTKTVADADAVVVGNSAPAHIAAAVGTPVVSVFAPVVPLHRWRPWRVRTVMLGNQEVGCAGCRARTCPLPTQLCVGGVDADSVMRALDRLAGLYLVSGWR